MNVACVDRWELLDQMFSALSEERGGWVITANLDFLRRFVKDPESRELYNAGDIIVADGMPLVWAAKLQGTPLPERIPGSTLTWLLAERAAQENRSLYLLGGDPGAAAAARVVLEERWPGLRIAGHSAPWVSNPPSQEELQSIAQEIRDCSPDIILVGLGSPKQEYVIQALLQQFPKAWMMGVGISFSFVAGQERRAPIWVRRIGLEWFHRLLHDPRRLAKRYLVDDLPFAFELLLGALKHRFSKS
ncbi:MAG: WecB/TagA/CpsF family glycosyltransferase [Deltaproteobacteria bacterium]|nr:WecB/TagA/CpsF family glycosyltransferase [Deltaproteobacteria bacterium]